MKLSAYVVKYDGGFAPNPFGGYCTLACCKPTIRRRAHEGDIIVGTAPSRYPHAGKLIYAMKVSEVLTFQQYWEDERFAKRKPSPSTPIGRRGDNIWHEGPHGTWLAALGGVHDQGHRDRDTSGINVLISTNFYYFGRKAIRVPKRFAGMLATTQGHKNTHDEILIKQFWGWLIRRAPRRGRIGNPSEFDEEGYQAECAGVEEEDAPECDEQSSCGPA